MRVTQAIEARRSVKRFTERPVTKDDIEALLSAAPMAPNHHRTQPWRFYVLGPEARYAYGLVLGGRKAKKLEDAAQANALTERVAAEHRALPAMLAVAMVEDENPERREEDYAAVMMGVQNIALTAVELGLGTHMKTGAIMQDPAARAAVGVGDNERIVVIVNVGEPAGPEVPRDRASASAFTAWRD